MNSSTQSPQTGPKPESNSKPTASPESSGSKATVDPILAVNSRADAQDILAVRDDLTRTQRRHLEKVILREHRVVRVGQPKQDASDYWTRKCREMTITQLDKCARRVIRDAKILKARASKLSKHSRFARAIVQEQMILIQKAAAVNEEIKARKAPTHVAA